MKNPNEGLSLPPAVLQKLTEIRREDRRVRFRTGLVRSLAVLLTVMLVAMVIDWLAVLHDERLRWALTLAALFCAALTVIKGCLLPLFKTRSLTSIAREVDSAHPGLEERYLTLTGFSQSQDAPELRGSDALLQQVAQQATAMSEGIAPRSVISRADLVRAGKYLCGAAAVLLLLFMVNFQQTKVLFLRFWGPGSDITLTQLNVKPGDIVVGKGDDVNLEITTSGKATQSADLFIQAANRNDVIALQRVAPADPKFVYAMNAVADSFQYRVRSGDNQTAWHTVTVVDRPKISQVKLRITPPAYSHLPVVEQSALPRQLRALEGSKLEVSLQADQPLAGMELKFANGKTQEIAESPDHAYHFNADLTNTIAFTPIFTNLHHLDNLPKPTCDIVVYADQPPTVSIITPKDEITARHDDKIKIEFKAKDDFGVASAELVVTVKGETNSTTVVTPIPLQEQAGAREVHKMVELDLAKLDLKQDQELSYYVRVKDTKENPALSSPDKSQSQNQETAAQPETETPKPQEQDTNQMAKAQASQSNGANSTNPSKSQKSSAANTAQAKSGTPKAGSTNSPTLAKADKPADNQQKDQPNPDSKDTSKAQADNSGHQDNKIHLAANAPPPKPKPPEKEQGDQPPPNDMQKRMLDVAQSCSCQPMKIKVDDWGRSYEGQMRDKLEIAIDPVIKQLDHLLAEAQQSTDDTLAAGHSAEGLSARQSPAVQAARDNLRLADSAVSDLKKVCHDTPYAFISLQLDDIRQAHMTPARKNLGDVALETATLKPDLANLQQGSFQIKTAREKLADLTKTYEAVKRDNKLADAMQRLAKMHQIFLEDTQAMLGSSKPILNPQHRKVAEVSDEYAQKLRKLLEEKKKIMAELAKILADDPRLLRRFMAMEQLEGATLRDQMTLLAERQQTLAKEDGQWVASTGADHPALLKAMLVTESAEQNDVAAQTSKLMEDMVTWAPLDVPADREPLPSCRNFAAEAARQASEAAKQATPETIDASLAAASNSLEQLRQLQSTLPGLDWLADSKEKISVFEANRLNDTADLITRQSGWIKKIQAVRSGDYAQVAEVDQHRLMLDTTTLSEKLDNTALSLASLSAAIKAKADELNDTVHDQILPDQSGATDALTRKVVQEAATHQVEATNAFAKGEKQFDDLLHMIIDKLDAAPPPTDVGQAKSLEELLAELQEEQKACEKLGVPCRPINVQVLKDWMKPGSCDNPGSAQAKAAQAQAKSAKQKAEQTRDKAKMLVQKRIEALPAPTKEGPKIGPRPPAASWNTLVSQLGDEIRQGRDNVPPEQYRQAIEQYFTTISEKTEEAPAAATSH